MDSLNRIAIERVDEAVEFADEFAIGVHELDSGATVLDFGLDAPGGIEAGLLLAELQTGGLATVSTRMDGLGGAPLPYVEVQTDHPDLALLCSQKAGWELSVGEFEGLGSGPARALVAEEAVFGRVGYADAFDLTVLAVETDRLPDDRVVREVADRTDVPPSAVYLAAYPTASVAGSVSVAARAAEVAVYRLFETGYDPAAVRSASGTAPVAPVAGEERTAIARTNDALAYGGDAHLVVEDDLDDPERVVSSAADDYGRPFESVFADVDWDFSELPRDLFAPARATVDVVGGPTHVVGARDDEVVAESFGLR